jgi:hypothetical protein
MKASWPATGCDVDAAALDQYEALKQLVRGVRNARLEYGLEQARKVSTGGQMYCPCVLESMRVWLHGTQKGSACWWECVRLHGWSLGLSRHARDHRWSDVLCLSDSGACFV